MIDIVFIRLSIDRYCKYAMDRRGPSVRFITNYKQNEHKSAYIFEEMKSNIWSSTIWTWSKGAWEHIVENGAQIR